MYKLSVKLKQHTPLIHFQHDQAGATLRASEVKPRIDNFIKKYLKKVDTELYSRFQNEIHKYFNSNNEKIESPYKLLIISDLRQKVFLFSNISKSNALAFKSNPKARKIGGDNFDIAIKTPLFTNDHLIRDESEWEKFKMGIWMDNTIVCISGKNLNINQLIRECLPYVFAMENFGLRQSKGFGCFTVGDEFPELITKFGKSIGVEGIYKSIFTEDWKIGLQRISKIWKLLKAGDTHNNPYYKSDLMKYLCLKDGTRWEKRKIKAEIYNNYPKVWEQLKHETINNRISGCHSDNDKAEEIKIAKEQYKYHRGLLGLAQNYEFQTNNRFRDSAMVEIDGDEIERFRSPVTFKIYNETIYMFCHPIPVNLWKSDDGNRIYSFKLKSNIANEPFSGTLAELEIPENFHVCDFLESKWVGENFENIKINWGNPNAPSVAKHHKFEKIQ